MLNAIDKQQPFHPKKALRTKYYLYIITILLSIMMIVDGFMFFISLVDDTAPVDGFITAGLVILIISLVIFIVTIPFVKWYFDSINYEILDDEVHAYRGIITRTRKIVPYRTITNIDVKQGPYDRLLNLGTIEIQTAGNSANKTGPEERIDGIPAELVEDIQERLINKVRRMRGSAGISHDLPDEADLLDNILYEVRELRKHIQNT